MQYPTPVMDFYIHPCKGILGDISVQMNGTA